jgi:LysR family glycine cleavage system transcriptional activator
MKSPPPLDYIRSFECAARHMSFTSAAKELGYTQAAVSNHIRVLEQYVGGSLFQRFARSLALTDIGEAFLPALSPAIAQIDNATEAVRSAGLNRSVTIACPVGLAENWLARCICEFWQKNPEIIVVVHATVWGTPLEPIADITITSSRHEEVHAGAVRLWDETLVLLAAPAFLERNRDHLSPRDILKTETILIHGRHENWTIMANALGSDEIDLERGLKTNTSNIALKLAACGAGYTITTASLARTYLDLGLLVEPIDLRPKSPWSYYLKVKQTRKGTATRKLEEWILAYEK